MLRGGSGFAAAEAKRLWTEANEDLEVRERRLQREKTMREVRESQRQEQQQRAQEALQVAEEMRLQGNDAFRQGQLPGNAASKQHLLQAVELYAEAIRTLSRCLETGLAMVPEQAAELTKQRGLLRSNAAQVELSGQRWLEAAALARAALEDDPASLKSQHRLAKAQLGLGDGPRQRLRWTRPCSGSKARLPVSARLLLSSSGSWRSRSPRSCRRRSGLHRNPSRGRHRTTTRSGLLDGGSPQAAPSRSARTMGSLGLQGGHHED